MKKLFMLAVLSISCIIFTSCVTQKKENNDTDASTVAQIEVSDEGESLPEKENEEEKKPLSFSVKLISNSIKDNNQINDKGEIVNLVLLPPSYYESNKRYPIIYFFHGYTETANSIEHMFTSITEEMTSEKLDEAIIVCVDASNVFGGSFMANSPVTGFWEDAMVKEIVPYMDEHYRTIAAKEARGLMGFSMGGYITVNLGFSYPDIFDATYAVAPGLLIDEEIDEAMETWNSQFLGAYGSAFCPDIDSESKYKYPLLDGSVEDEEVIEKWLSGFGHMEKRIEDYQNHNSKLDGIGLEVALNDYYPWITNGTLHFSQLLSDNNIIHQLIETNNNHKLPKESVLENGLPFLLEHLEKATEE